MDRDKAKALLPVLTALANGETIQVNLNGIWVDRTNPEFDLPPECYRIAKPKEKMPLEAEDWIKDGPWWVRGDGVEGMCMVKTVTMSVICFDTSDGYRRSMQIPSTLHLDRRNAASDWMPCWKEKE